MPLDLQDTSKYQNLKNYQASEYLAAVDSFYPHIYLQKSDSYP